MNRLKKACRFTVITGTITRTIAGAVLYFMAPWLLWLFAAGDESVIRVGVKALRMQSVVMPLLTVGVCSNLTYQAIGRPWMSTFLASLRQGIAYLPLILLLPLWFGETGMLAAQPIADAITFVVCAPLLWKYLKKEQ